MKYRDEAVERLIRAFADASDCTMCPACGHCDVTDRFGKNRKVNFQRCCEWISRILIEWSLKE